MSDAAVVPDRTAQSDSLAGSPSSKGEEPIQNLSHEALDIKFSSGSLAAYNQAEERPTQQSAWNFRHRVNGSAPEEEPAAEHHAQTTEQLGPQLHPAEPTAAHQQHASTRESPAESSVLHHSNQQSNGHAIFVARHSTGDAHPAGLENGDAADRRSAAIASISGTGYLTWLPDGRLSGARHGPSTLTPHHLQQHKRFESLRNTQPNGLPTLPSYVPSSHMLVGRLPEPSLRLIVYTMQGTC